MFLLTYSDHICFSEQQRSNSWANLCLKSQTWCSNAWSWTFFSNEALTNRIITMSFSQKWMRNVSDVNEKHSELTANLNSFFFSIIFNSPGSTSTFQSWWCTKIRIELCRISRNSLKIKLKWTCLKGLCSARFITALLSCRCWFRSVINYEFQASDMWNSRECWVRSWWCLHSPS